MDVDTLTDEEFNVLTRQVWLARLALRDAGFLTVVYDGYNDPAEGDADPEARYEMNVTDEGRFAWALLDFLRERELTRLDRVLELRTDMFRLDGSDDLSSSEKE